MNILPLISWIRSHGLHMFLWPLSLEYSIQGNLRTCSLDPESLNLWSLTLLFIRCVNDGQFNVFMPRVFHLWNESKILGALDIKWNYAHKAIMTFLYFLLLLMPVCHPFQENKSLEKGENHNLPLCSQWLVHPDFFVTPGVTFLPRSLLSVDMHLSYPHLRWLEWEIFPIGSSVWKLVLSWWCYLWELQKPSVKGMSSGTGFESLYPSLIVHSAPCVGGSWPACLLPLTLCHTLLSITDYPSGIVTSSKLFSLQVTFGHGVLSQKKEEYIIYRYLITGCPGWKYQGNKQKWWLSNSKVEFTKALAKDSGLYCTLMLKNPV